MRFSKVLSLFLLIALCISAFIAIDARRLVFPDDSEYVKMYFEIVENFSGAQEKYGVAFKSFVVLVNSLFEDDVIKIFSLIPVLVAAVLVLNGVRNPTILFLAVFMSMPVLWLVQIRQALAIVFVLSVITARNNLIYFVSLVVAFLSHFAVVPFLFWHFSIYYLMPRLLRGVLINFLLFFIFLLLFYFAFANIDGFSSISGFPLGLYVSNEALYLGRLGIGTVAIFYLLLSFIYFVGALDRGSIFSMLMVCSAIIIISMHMPLLQRFLLPFIIFEIVIIFLARFVSIFAKLFILSILFIFSVVKFFDTFAIYI